MQHKLLRMDFFPPTVAASLRRDTTGHSTDFIAEGFLPPHGRLAEELGADVFFRTHRNSS